MDLTNPQITLRQARIEQLRADLAAAQATIEQMREALTEVVDADGCICALGCRLKPHNAVAHREAACGRSGGAEC